MSASSSRISVIIPALNEREALPGNLQNLLGFPEIHECIVVDGGSTDGSQDAVSSLADRRLRLLHSEPGRGRQMNVGARAATGDVLLFHHADTHLPRAAFKELLALAVTDSPGWGGFQQAFDQPNWKLRLVSWLHNFRFARTGVVYGDQSMFIQAGLFRQLGGFPESELEDLQFSDKALQHVPSSRLHNRVITNSRKFRQLGELRALAHVVAIIVRYQLNRSIANERFFLPYR